MDPKTKNKEINWLQIKLCILSNTQEEAYESAVRLFLRFTFDGTV